MVEKVEVCQVLYNFDTEEDGEITLHPGSYVQVLSQVNEDWLKGYSGGKVGNFPAAFVERSAAIALPTTGKVFVCIEEFPELQPGDLAINPGNVIVGLEEVNADWWRGHIEGRVGIFPLTHVEEVELKLSNPVAAESTSTDKSAAGSGDQVLYQVRAVLDTHAQLDDELSFFVGDVIQVIREQDDDWLIGTCNGSTGMFLKDLTVPVEGSTPSPVANEMSHTVPMATDNYITTSTEQGSQSGQANSSEIVHAQTDTASVGRVLYNFQAESSSELSLVEGQTVANIRSIDSAWSEGTCNGCTGMFPSAYVEITGSVADTVTDQVVPANVTAGVRVLYDFASVTADEISLREGQLVSVVSKEVDGWSRVHTAEGHEGLCPSSFLEFNGVVHRVNGVVQEVCGVAQEVCGVVQEVCGVAQEVSEAVQVGHTDIKQGSHSRPSSTISNSNLDDSISAEMAKAKIDADKKLSQRQKPAKPKGPARPVTPTKPVKSPGPARPSSPAKLPSLARPCSPAKPHSPSSLRSSDSFKQVREKPARPTSTARPPSTAQPDDRPSSGSPSPYDTLKEPFESKMEWRDEHPAPLITRRSTEKAPPVKPPPPKRLPSSSELAVSSLNEPIEPSPSAQQPVESSKVSPVLPVAPPEPTQSNGQIDDILKEDTSLKAKELTNEAAAKEGSDAPLTSTVNTATPGDSQPTILVSSDIAVSTPTSLADQPAVSKEETNQQVPAGHAPTRPAPTRPAPTRPAPTRPSRGKAGSDITADTKAAVTAPSSPTKPIPTRPAPTRPAPSKPVPVRAAPSPPTTSVTVEAVYDEHAANHLKERIQLLERDIANYNTEVENLDGQSEEDDVLDEKLKFYIENINGMTLEADELKAQLNAMESLRKQSRKSSQGDTQRLPPPVNDPNSAENREKRRVKRVNKIEELIKSEQFYLRDLNLCMQVFNSETGLQAPEAVDKDTLFCYMPDIISLSQSLLGMLESSVESAHFDKQIIAKPFIDLKEDMMNAYALYCRNYDEVCNLLEQYKSNADIRAYFSEGLDMIAKHRPEKPFTVDAFLITPVQRVPRYVMLLMELAEATEVSHPDKQQLELAKSAQEQVANHINEFKRRNDLVNKYKAREREDEDRLSRLNMHSIRKKTSRMSRRIGNYVGLSPQYVDKEFDREAAYFKDLEGCIRDFIKNLDCVLSNLRSCHDVKEAVATDISEYLSALQTEEVKLYLQAQRNISSAAFKLFKSELEASVLDPLLKLLALFQGPSKLITKRGDKRLDFDSAHSRFEKNKDDKTAMEELDRAKKDFHALNTQLKEELPKFNSLVYDIFKDCVSEFTRLYRVYFGESYGFILPILQSPLFDASPGSSAIMDRFEKDYTVAAQMLTSSADPKLRKVSESRRNASTSVAPSTGGQTSDMCSRLTSSYPSHKLYRAAADYTPSDSMELRLSKGDLVGVVQQKDPMGNEERWYIDNGAEMGFVKKVVLQPNTEEADGLPVKHSVSPLLSPRTPHTPLSPLPSPNVLPPLEVENTPQTSQINPAQDRSPPPAYDQIHEVFQALYDFTPRNPNELSLTAEQIIHVHRKCDEHGNPEWWYAESSNGFGYAPANYLTPHSEN